jgi:RND family efflux transporter MFP subunit
MKNKYNIILTLSILVMLNSCGNKIQEIEKKSDIIPVSVIELSQQKIENTIDVSGTFTSEDETILSFKTGGVIRTLYVKEGDAIKKSQLLASLDLNEIQYNVNQATAGYEKAKRDFERVTNLYKDSVATLTQMLDTKTAMEVAQQNLNIAKFNLSYSEIRAVENGYVLSKFANVGQVVGPGTPVLLTNGANNNNWVLKTAVSDRDWNIIRIGDKSVVSIGTNGENKVNAIVYKKSEGIDPYSGTLAVYLKLTGKSPIKIATGIFGIAEIQTQKQSNGWEVPFESIIDGDAGNGYLFVTNDMKKATKVKVKISEIKNDKVLISSGLENYSYIISTGSAYLNDGSEIKVLNKGN